jgi:hypothetical protein
LGHGRGNVGIGMLVKQVEGTKLHTHALSILKNGFNSWYKLSNLTMTMPTMMIVSL